MPNKIPRIDSRIMEEWNRNNPKLGITDSKSNIGLQKSSKYGNYNLRNALMELISFLKNQYNVVVMQKSNEKYFKELEKEIIDLAIEMVKLL